MAPVSDNWRREFHTLLVSAFSVDELHRLVSFDVDLRRLADELPIHGAPNQVGFDLMQAAERRGVLDRLLRCIATERPRLAGAVASIEAARRATQRPERTGEVIPPDGVITRDRADAIRRQLRATPRTPAGVHATAKNAIYVPYTHIHDDVWLSSAYFLWDQIYILRPAGVHESPGRLERQLREFDPGFVRSASEFTPVMPRALERYGSLLERLHAADSLDPLLRARMVEGSRSRVFLYDSKIDGELLALWDEYGLATHRRGRGYEVPTLWGDLWIVTLATELGRGRDVCPVTDDPSCVELIRTVARASADAGAGRRALDAQRVSSFTRLALPAPGVDAGGPRPRVTRAWVDLKRSLLDPRDAYFAAVSRGIDRIPADVEPSTPLDAIVADARARFANTHAPRWSDALEGAGLRWAEWAMFAEIELASRASERSRRGRMFAAAASATRMLKPSSRPAAPAIRLFEYGIRRLAK